MSSMGLSLMSSAFGFGSDDISSVGTSIHDSRSLISFESAGTFARASGRHQEGIVRGSFDENQDERPHSLRKLRTPSLRTTGSSDSNAGLENSIREGITNLRPIVKLTKSGVVSAGTLEGFVERLITSFSAPYFNSSLNPPSLIVLRRFTAGHGIRRHTVDGMHRLYDPRRFFWSFISTLLRRRTV